MLREDENQRLCRSWRPKPLWCLHYIHGEIDLPHRENSMTNAAKSFMVIVITFFATSAAAQVVEVVVGNESVTKAPQPGKLSSPFGIDFDDAGSMFIVELAGGRVHHLDSDGKFQTISGDGSEGYTGDGGPARKATFDGMHNVAVTPKGDAYIADSWNHCIRKIDATTGVITTIAGTGEAGFSGDGGPATKATFNFLMCVSLNPANDKLYVADLKNRRIRSVDLKTGLVSTVAGNGKKGVPIDGGVATKSPLVDPRAVCVDSKDNVYVLERGGHALRVVAPDGKIKTVAGTGRPSGKDGQALEAGLSGPKHLAVDRFDRVIIADDQNAKIRLYDPVKGNLVTILGGGDEPYLPLRRPHGVCVHEDGSIYVVDTGNHRILKFTIDPPNR